MQTIGIGLFLYFLTQGQMLKRKCWKNNAYLVYDHGVIYRIDPIVGYGKIWEPTHQDLMATDWEMVK